MGTDREVEDFLVRCGLVEESLQQLRPRLARWRRRLEMEGVTRVPLSPWSTAPEDQDAVNLLTQMVLQASPERNAPKAHAVRNLTGFRPYKP
jgi:hypothetical protein